jgi:hypothetical protein
VFAEQAIFTSLPRRGKAGYHLVARSPGVSDVEANALTTWSPSHGALIVDAENRQSANFHPLPGGRFALSRTCEGLAEYSGRGGRQLYSHTLIIGEKVLRQFGNQPFLVFRDALALGYLTYRPDPETTLERVPLGSLHDAKSPEHWRERSEALGIDSATALASKLGAGEVVALAYAGDRLILAECLVSLVPDDVRPKVSFATSLRPSLVRPYQLVLTDAKA